MFILIIFKKSKTTGKIMEIHWSNCVQTPVEKLFITKNIKPSRVHKLWSVIKKIGYYFILRTNFCFLIHLYNYF